MIILIRKEHAGERSLYICTYIIYLFIIFGCTGSLLLCRLSLAAASEGHSLVVVHRLLTVAASILAERGL